MGIGQSRRRQFTEENKKAEPGKRAPLSCSITGIVDLFSKLALKINVLLSLGEELFMFWWTQVLSDTVRKN